MDEHRHTHRLYLQPTGEWTPDPGNARLRMDASTRTRVHAETSNLIYVRDTKGAWSLLEDESELSATERGLVWWGWPTAAGGHQYLAFKGVRVLDQMVVELLLEGLTVYDENGSVIDERESTGQIFLLSVEDAGVFNNRVKSVGGIVHRGDPMPEAALAAAEVVEKCALAMERLAGEDEVAVNEASKANFSGRSAFERRREGFDTYMQRARSAFNECERALRPISLPGRSLDEQAQAMALRERAARALALAGSLYEQREVTERDLAREIAFAEGNIPEGEPPAQRLLLLRALGRVARERGLETVDTPEGVRVLTSRGWLQLGPGFDFEED